MGTLPKFGVSVREIRQFWILPLKMYNWLQTPTNVEIETERAERSRVLEGNRARGETQHFNYSAFRAQ